MGTTSLVPQICHTNRVGVLVKSAFRVDAGAPADRPLTILLLQA